MQPQNVLHKQRQTRKSPPWEAFHRYRPKRGAPQLGHDRCQKHHGKKALARQQNRANDLGQGRIECFGFSRVLILRGPSVPATGHRKYTYCDCCGVCDYRHENFGDCLNTKRTRVKVYLLLFPKVMAGFALLDFAALEYQLCRPLQTYKPIILCQAARQFVWLLLEAQLQQAPDSSSQCYLSQLIQHDVLS